MRTKSLIVAAAISAAGLASSFAQSNVYSLNIVGYVNTPVVAGYNLISNPLKGTTNDVGSLITPPDFTDVLKWNGSGFTIASYFLGAWSDTFSLDPGESFFVNSPSAFTNTFVGEVLTGNQTNAFPAGYSYKASKIPVGGDADTLGLTSQLADFDNVLVFDTAAQSYVIYTYFLGAWDQPTPPPIPVGKGIVINAAAGGSWTQTLNP
jgi:hypothetical protein